MSHLIRPLVFVFFLFPLEAYGHNSAGFDRWVRDFYSVAREHGISREVYDSAFRDIKFDSEVLRLASHQPEFEQLLWQYFDNRVTQDAVRLGREMNTRWHESLTRIERDYGVSRYILLAIWSMETSYGRVLERRENLRPVIGSLATLAYGDPSRSKFARSQLIAALKILRDNRTISGRDFLGSWAGAMGHTQFIPTSYLAYARDGDGDGVSDIWTSVPDALATAANLLRENGWRTGQTWGYEVDVPRSLTSRSGDQRTIMEWERSGVSRTKGRSFPHKQREAVLRIFESREGPSFLMLRNFYVLKRYNNADKYALAVGHLADRISGGGLFSRDFVRPHRRMTLDEKRALQRELTRGGFYSDQIDGKIGPATRSAIRRAQEQLGMEPDGFESPELLSRLRDSN